MDEHLVLVSPLKETYKNDRFIFEKPILIICNKFNSEWGNPPITFLSVEVLDEILNKLNHQFQIIYCRPGTDKIIDDNSDVYELKDHEFIQKNYPNVILIEDLHEAHSDLSFNELQLMCFANANHFISVQGISFFALILREPILFMVQNQRRVQLMRLSIRRLIDGTISSQAQKYIMQIRTKN